MFSLIITIISIALVAALALATIYYGGTAFNKGSDQATASRFINEGQQVNGAVAMAKADIASGTTASNAVTTLDSLVTANYLAQKPADWTLTGADVQAVGAYVSHSVSGKVCGVVNEKAGVSPATGTLPTAVAAVYGCIPGATATDNGSMFYKL